MSLLDQCLSRSQDVTVEVVTETVGLAGRDYLYDLAGAISRKDSAAALTMLSDLYAASCDMGRLCVELIDRFRSFLIIKTVQHPENLIVWAETASAVLDEYYGEA